MTAKEPKPPKHITGLALDQYFLVVKLLQDLGTYSDADLPIIYLYCKSYERYRIAEQHVETDGAVLTSDNGNSYFNPHWSICKCEGEVCRKLLGELGLSASSRARMGTNKETPTIPDSVKRFLA